MTVDSAKKIITEGDKNSPEYMNAVSFLVSQSYGPGDPITLWLQDNLGLDKTGDGSVSSVVEKPEVLVGKTTEPVVPTSTPSASSPGGTTVGSPDAKVQAEMDAKKKAETNQPVPMPIPDDPRNPDSGLKDYVNDSFGSTLDTVTKLEQEDRRSRNGGYNDTPTTEESSGMYGYDYVPDSQKPGFTGLPEPGSGVPTDATGLGGNTTGLNSDYLMGINPGDPSFLNEILMRNGEQSGGATMGYLTPLAQKFGGMNELANPNMSTTQQSQIQNADKLYTGLAQGKGGVGMVDAGKLYDGMFSGGAGASTGPNGSLVNQTTPDKQYEKVTQMLDSLGAVMPPESLAKIQGNVNRAYLDFSHQSANGGTDASFIDYLRSVGAEDWF